MQNCQLAVALLCLTLAAASPRCVCPPTSPSCPSLQMIDCNPPDKCVVKRDASDNVGITVAEVIDEGKCNNDALREIMLEHMSQNVREAKIEIMRAAEAKLGGHFNVICARGDFSYITTTRLYCLQSVADINCYAFLADIQRTENMPEPHKPRTRAH